MKKHLLLFIILLLCISTVEAQNYGTPKKVNTQFGVKAGVNLSNINNGSNIDLSSSMKIGFNVGAVVNLHFGYLNDASDVGTGLFGLQAELLYSSQGFKCDDTNISLNYITLPIMAKFYVSKGFNIEAGPYFSYLISTSPETAVVGSTQVGISDLNGGMDAGVGVGLGYELRSGLNFGARYNLGLSDVANNLLWKNNGIAISIGYLF
ncbi:MAG: porin family protein [Rikenellaceae bacterium]